MESQTSFFFYPWRNWGSGRGNDFTKVTQTGGRHGVGNRSYDSSPVSPAIFINPCVKFWSLLSASFSSFVLGTLGAFQSINSLLFFQKEKRWGQLCFRSVKGADSPHHYLSEACSVPGTRHPGYIKDSFQRLKSGFSVDPAGPGLECHL